jgi:murein DD-endopeptidase MepM/ murein hydrolase activator NlpD
MIFSSLKNKSFGYVDLNEEAKGWALAQGLQAEALLDPVISTKMVEDVHKKYNIDFSYGGWMEDRRFLWKGTYLEPLNTFIHLGIDINVSAGTEIYASFEARVVRIDDDYPEEGGWGPRIIIKHLSQPFYFIYAHLDGNIACKVGDIIRSGEIFAKVGNYPYNGNWFPHVHVQSLSEEYYLELERNNSWGNLDGYGSEEDLTVNVSRFPDPLQFISLAR